MDRREFVVQSSCAILGTSALRGFVPQRPDVARAGVRISSWERGIAVESAGQPDMAMFLWFYEWNMFDAVQTGEHTLGMFENFGRTVEADRNAATISDGSIKLTVTASEDAADLLLEVVNRSDHEWGPLAAIIPCLSPGRLGGNLSERRGSAEGLLPPRTPNFANENTFFLGASGLERLSGREIRFNGRLRPELDAVAPDGLFVFSEKWPTARPDAQGAFIVRESTDGVWVSGMAWEEFLSVQAHNPWQCMHLAPRVGPLRRGDSMSMRGKIYLLRGTRHECLQRYLNDFT